MPIYTFFLPLYSFWNFDDFSWGSTRRIETDEENGFNNANNEIFCKDTIPLKTWEEFKNYDLEWRKKQNQSSTRSYSDLIFSD